MRVPAIERPIEAFEQRNAFVRAVLGLVPTLETFNRVLDEHAPWPEAARSIGEDPPNLLLLVLGSIAVKGELEDILLRARLEKPARTTANAASEPLSKLGSLFR